jgi:hypothetical protein
MAAPSDMVGWWSGDNNGLDLSGLLNHGTLQGNAGYVGGKVADAFLLAGSGGWRLVNTVRRDAWS